MTKEIERIHALIQYYETIGAWGMAEQLRKVLVTMLEEVKDVA